MNLSRIVLFALLPVVCGSFGRHNLKPLSFVKHHSKLLATRSQFGESKSLVLQSPELKSIASLHFESKDYKVEELGNTPDYAISLEADKGIRVCLISVWKLDSGKLAININDLLKEKFYHGFLIEQEKFESVFDFTKAKP